MFIYLDDIVSPRIEATASIYFFQNVRHLLEGGSYLLYFLYLSWAL